jgi:hypothetical protein
MHYFSWIILFLVSAISFLNSEFRKGSLKTTRPHYSDTFFTDVPPNKTFKAIMEFATNNGYRIDDFDEQQLAVILNERMTLMSYGSLYPIYVRAQGAGTMVEIGVTSKFPKFFLISPVNKKLVTLRLERMLNGVKGAVFAYGIGIERE